MDLNLIAAAVNRIEIRHEPWLDKWACWVEHGWPPRMHVGSERWEQCRWLPVKERVLESDPGPLDARVP